MQKAPNKDTLSRDKQIIVCLQEDFLATGCCNACNTWHCWEVYWLVGISVWAKSGGGPDLHGKWAGSQCVQRCYGSKCQDREDETFWARNQRTWRATGGEKDGQEVNGEGDKKKEKEKQGERGDGGQQPAGFRCPLSPVSFSDICCLCRNRQGMLLLILSTWSEWSHPA